MATANGKTNSASAASSVNSVQSADFSASKKAALEAFEKLLEAKDHFATAATATGLDLKDDAMGKVENGKVKLSQAGQRAQATVREKPLAAIGLAFLAGLIVSLLFPRKS